MLRVLGFVALLAVGRANDENCNSEQMSMLQVDMPSARDDQQLRVNDTEEWDFHHFDLDDLLDRFDVSKIKDKFNKILEERDLSLEDLQQRIGDFTTKFQDRMNKTVAQTQEKLASMKEDLKTKGKGLKNKVLLQTSEKVTKLGESAMDVAEKVTTKVGDARAEVAKLLERLDGEEVENAKESIRQSLDAAVNTLDGFVQSLMNAVRFRESSSLLSVSDAEPDALDKTVEKTKQVLQKTDHALETASLYVEYVNKTIVDTKAKAEALAEELSQKADDAIDSSDKLADELIDQLGDINTVLAGKLSVDELKTKLAKSSSPRAASVWLGLVPLCLAIHAQL